MVAAALDDSSTPLDELAELTGLTDQKICLLLGTEGSGLSAGWMARADHVVEIPMARGVDSLNVATAAAVLCWELRPR